MLVQPGTLPKTSSGKLQRAKCRELYLGEELELVPAISTSSSSELGRPIAGDHVVAVDLLVAPASGDALARWAASQNAAPPGVSRGSALALMYVRPNARSSSGRVEANRLGEAPHRVGDTTRPLPRRFDRIVVVARRRWDEPVVTEADQLRAADAQRVERRVAIGRHEGVEEDELANAIVDVFGGTGDDDARRTSSRPARSRGDPRTRPG